MRERLTNLSWQACDRRTKNRWHITIAVPIVVCGLQQTHYSFSLYHITLTKNHKYQLEDV